MNFFAFTGQDTPQTSACNSMGSRKEQQGLGESEPGLVVLSILSHDLENEILVKFVDDC